MTAKTGQLHGRDHGPDGIDPIPGGTGNVPRMVWGALYNDANIIAGTGFTAAWEDFDSSSPGVNYYTITFDDAFTNPPIVLLAPNNNNPPGEYARYTATLLRRTAGYIVVLTANVDDADSLADQDGGFDFLAIEPAV